MAETLYNFSIVLLTRNRLEFFDPSQKKVFPFVFPQNLVSDMEIINKNELESQISLFINYYKINPDPIIILLAKDICFELEIPDTNEANMENQINNFLYYLPFEESIHKIYKQTKGYILSAVNKELVEIFKLIFSKSGFYVEGVIPSSIAGIDIKTIDAPTAQFIMAKINQIKNQSMVETSPRLGTKPTPEKKVFGMNRVFIFLAVFLVLLLLLLIMLYKQSLPQKKPTTSINPLTISHVFSSVKLRG